jgi:multiple antibiotic resistance protein
MALDFAIYSFITLFIIVDPVVNVPLFMAILADVNSKNRKIMVKKAVIIAAVVLIIFTLSGNVIFKYLGIEMYSFRIAGGILLFMVSLEMLFGKKPGTKSTLQEEEEAMHKDDVVVTPLAVPLLTGPGAITSGIVLFNSAKSVEEEISLFAAILLVFLLSYIILSRSEKLFEKLGHTGTMVIVRIMGLLLAAIAIQFVITGIRDAAAGIL